MKLTPAQRKEIKKTAEKAGVSEEAMADFEVVKAMVALTGINALEATGYRVFYSTVKEAT